MPVFKGDQPTVPANDPPVYLCPVEVLALIFDYCDNVFDRMSIASVCRQWRAVVRDNGGKRLDLSTPYRGYAGGMSENAMCRTMPGYMAQSVTTLCLDRLTTVSTHAIHSMLYQCVNLQRFTMVDAAWFHFIVLDLNLLPRLEFADVRETCVHVIGNGTEPRLHLTLGFTRYGWGEVSGTGFGEGNRNLYMGSAASSCVAPKLTDRMTMAHRGEQLAATGPTPSYDQGSRIKLPQPAPGSIRAALKGLTVEGAWVPSLTTEGAKYITSFAIDHRTGDPRSEQPQNIFSPVFTSPLTSLTLRGFRFSPKATRRIDFDDVTRFSATLTHLDLSFSDVPQDSFIAVVAQCKLISNLVLRHTTGLAAAAAAAIGKMPALVKVDVTLCGLGHVHHPTATVLTNTPMPKHMVVPNVPVPEAEIDEDRVAPPMRRCVLGVHGCDWTGPCRDVSNHLFRCPFNIISCSICREPVQRAEMQAHIEMHSSLPYYQLGRTAACPCCRMTLRAEPLQPDCPSLNAQMQRHLLTCPAHDHYLPPLMATSTHMTVLDKSKPLTEYKEVVPQVNPRDVAVDYVQDTAYRGGGRYYHGH